MKIVFMGTPEFAVPSLKMLIDEGYEVVAVVTQPDKPKGRGNKMAAPPVKEFAESKGIQVLQPSKIKTPEFANELASFEPDLLVTAAYGKILPDYVLSIPKHGCINVHGSLLPKLRGAAPIQWSIINGDKVTGITTMFTDIGMDTGDMLLKKEVEITDQMTASELHDKLSVVGPEVLKETLKALVKGNIIRIPQENLEATNAPIMTKEIGLINWNTTAINIHNLIRGTNPWPVAYTFLNEDKVKIWSSEVIKEASNKNPGTIIRVDKQGILVATSENCLLIKELQFESSKRMTVETYLCGHKIESGIVLG